MCSIMQKVLIWLSLVCGLTVADILVTTPKGSVRGIAKVTPENRTYYKFARIPFAKPPVGKLRFQAPVEADPWDEVLDGSDDPPRCFQVSHDYDDETEDCLFINVQTPALDLANSSKKLPVVLGIYGGGFRVGSATTGGQYWFIERDIVVVNFNYRIGPFGFLSTSDMVVPGNAGLKDQQLALQWTYDNIEYFGGNKSHITLAGQSAGGASVTYQLLNKKSSGLLKSALVRSGSALCSWAYKDDNLPFTRSLAKIINNRVDLENTTTAYLLEFLQNASAREVDAASFALPGIFLPTFEPEHGEAFLTTSMYESLEAGNFTKVPLLIGINSEEKINMANNIPSIKAKAASYDKNSLSLLSGHFSEASSVDRHTAAARLKQVYVGNDTFSNQLGRVVSFASDIEFTRSVIRFGEMYARHSDVYFYQFSYKGKMGIYTYHIDGADNVAHGEEGRYISIYKIGHYDNTKYDQFPESDVTTHWRLVELWSNFYKYGNPTPEPVELLQNITWPKVTEKKFIYLHINTTLELMDTPKYPRYNTWRDIIDKYANRPFIVY